MNQSEAHRGMNILSQGMSTLCRPGLPPGGDSLTPSDYRGGRAHSSPEPHIPRAESEPRADADLVPAVLPPHLSRPPMQHLHKHPCAASLTGARTLICTVIVRAGLAAFADLTLSYISVPLKDSKLRLQTSVCKL